jgi:hypothetical protein
MCPIAGCCSKSMSIHQPTLEKITLDGELQYREAKLNLLAEIRKY